ARHLPRSSGGGAKLPSGCSATPGTSRKMKARYTATATAAMISKKMKSIDHPTAAKSVGRELASWTTAGMSPDDTPRQNTCQWGRRNIPSQTCAYHEEMGF